MPTLIGIKDFGGGFVRLSFSCNGERLAPGTPLTPEQIKSFANHKRLIHTGHIAVYPRAKTMAESDAAATERLVVHRGGGRYDVIVGAVINDTALTREEAEALALSPSS